MFTCQLQDQRISFWVDVPTGLLVPLYLYSIFTKAPSKTIWTNQIAYYIRRERQKKKWLLK